MAPKNGNPEKGAERPAPGPNSPASFLLVVVVNVCILALVFGGLEFAIRWHHRRPFRSTLKSRDFRDPWTAWRNSPHFTDTNGARHDAQGFRRDVDVALDKPPNTVRVFFLGGSAAYGDSGGYREVENRHYVLLNSQLIDTYLEKELNAAFPSKHWEVINAATMEYRMHQELALIESVLLRYQPDYVILMDGYNDLVGFGSASDHYDAYASTPHLDEFNLLANPSSGRSFLFFTTTWLRANSDLFRTLSDHLQQTSVVSRRGRRAARGDFRDPVSPSELAPEAQARFTTAESQIGEYTHVARQISRILELDGVKPVFLLQPVLILSHKPLTDNERRIRAYTLGLYGPLQAYTFEQLYPRISQQMQLVGMKDGFGFLDLTDVFDRTSGQAFTDYCHLTPEGDHVIAERVFDFMHDSFAQAAR